MVTAIPKVKDKINFRDYNKNSKPSTVQRVTDNGIVDLVDSDGRLHTMLTQGYSNGADSQLGKY